MYKSIVINLNSKIESKSGGVVGFYIKEHMNFNVRHDLGKIDETIEILWVEVQGRNRNTPVLVGQYMKQVQMKLKNLFGLKKFDRILTEIYLKWSGVIIIVGDFNTDLLNEKTQS